MRKDIYVVQKTAEEGKHLEDWCIQNDVTVNMNYGLGFNPEWNCFAYFNSIDAFCKNYELSSCKLNMQEVTIEEFKRLQLESLGKTEELKIGDYVTVTDEDVNSEFKMIGKVIEVRSDKDESNIRGKADFISVTKKEFRKTQLWCYKDNRTRTYRKSTQEEIEWLNECIKQDKYIPFEDLPKQKQNKFEVGKWYKWTHANWFLKYLEGDFVFSECIKNGEYKKIRDFLASGKTYDEVDLKQIQPYLPDGHPDKIVKSVLEYVKLEKGWSKDDEYIGEIFELKTLNNLSKFQYAPSKEIFLQQIENWIKKGLFTQATKEEWEEQNKPSYEYEVVHCKTQEQWDFVCETLGYKHVNKHWEKSDYNCINLVEDLGCSLDWYENKNSKIYSFEEWCNMNGHSFEPVKQKSIDFGELNLEDWFRETKKLNLNLEKLERHINFIDTCNPIVYKQLKGDIPEEKAEILWNEWNAVKGECTLTSQYPLTFIESFKPNTHIHKAQLIEVKTKQIFKN